MVLPEAAVSAVFETLFIIDDYTEYQACVWYHDPIQGTLDGPQNIKFDMLVSTEFGGGLRTPLCLSLVSGGMSGFNSEYSTNPHRMLSFDSTRTEYQDQDDRPFHPGHTEGGF